MHRTPPCVMLESDERLRELERILQTELTFDNAWNYAQALFRAGHKAAYVSSALDELLVPYSHIYVILTSRGMKPNRDMTLGFVNSTEDKAREIIRAVHDRLNSGVFAQVHWANYPRGWLSYGRPNGGSPQYRVIVTPFVVKDARDYRFRVVLHAWPPEDYDRGEWRRLCWTVSAMLKHDYPDAQSWFKHGHKDKPMRGIGNPK